MAKDWPGDERIPRGARLARSQIGWMGRLLKVRWCAECGVKATEAWKVYWEYGDMYRTTYNLRTYCRPCADVIVEAYTLDRLVNNDG